MLTARQSSPRAQRDRLIAEGLPLVRRLAFRLARRLPPNVDVGDLIGAGSEGLVRAADAYDPARHASFAAYAEMRIRGAMLDELRSLDPMTRHGRRRLAEVTKAVQELTRTLGRAPEEAEVAGHLGLELDEYRRLCEEAARVPALARTGDIDPDVLVQSDSDVFTIVEERERSELLARAIDALPERSRMVLALYYQEQCTQAEIGKILGVTEGRVCQILGESAARLRAALADDERSATKMRRATKPRREEAKP
ncbi:MAG: RNA polymerase sigma factor FliA [Myxococcota bacterium]|nr:RNA polymerase sigma factor FliA [Myxococcota bacterium]